MFRKRRYLRKRCARTTGLALGLGLCIATAMGQTAPSGGPANATSRSSYTAEPVAPDDRVDDLPVEARGIEIEERIGQSLPLDANFRNTEGESVRLGDLFDGELPVILTFNYSSCPMLCSLQLNALFQSIKKLPFDVGDQYRMITVGLDPKETPDTAKTTKEKFLGGFADDKRELAAAGWTFLTGREDAIKAAADAAGVRYRYLEKTKEYVHPASLIFVSPKGIITQYYHGIHYEPEVLGNSIFQAGAGEHGVSIGFLLACFRIGERPEYAKMSENIMRYGAIGFVLLLLVAFGTWQVMRSREARQE